jgi:hypothetical protein
MPPVDRVATEAVRCCGELVELMHELSDLATQDQVKGVVALRNMLSAQRDLVAWMVDQAAGQGR